MVYFLRLSLLAFLLFSGQAAAQCVGALQSGSNLSDVCSASTSINNILPSQTSNSGKVLTTNGTVASWGTAAAGSVTSVATGAGLTGGTITSTGTIAATTNTLTSAIEFIIDGGGSALTTSTCGFSSGQLCTLEVPFACTITAARMFADQTGSAVIEIAKTTYSAYAPGTHPVSGDKITSSTPPTISSAAKSQDTTLTSWTTSVSAGDILAVSVTSATTITKLTVSLSCVRT
jgi:hypothetical protein